jgi:putative PEP-CTERM system TPR-repeat lipoprotein
MRILTILSLALAILVAGCGPSDPQALVASAKEYIAKRDFNASIIQLKNALQKEPKNAEARYLLGLASLENADLSSAEVELGKARELGYRGEELQVALARTVLAKGEPANVVRDFGAMKLSSPTLQAQLRAVVGNAELAQNHRGEAESAFREALTLDANSVGANVGLARFAAGDGDFARATAHVNTALAASPSDGDALLLKADLLAAQGQQEAAEAAYREAVGTRPTLVPPRVALITHLLRNGALDKASAEVDALQKMAPKDPRSAYAKALLLGQEQKYAAARQAILQVLKVAPNHVPSLMIAGMAAFGMQAYSEAESHFRKALQYAPNAVGPKRFLAATHLRLGRTDLALTELKELLSQSAEDPGIIALAGEASLANGNVALAQQYYEKAKSLAPDSATVQTRLALVRLAAGEADRGLKELESASASHPDDYQADLALITAYLRQRQPDKALQAVQALEKKQPDNPLTHNLRGIALLLRKDFAGARASFEHAIALNPTYMPAVTNLVQLDLHDNKRDAARKRYEAVLEKEPNNEQALLGAAVLLRITGASGQEIEKLLRHAVASNPSSPNARGTLINFYLRNRDFPRALAAAQEAWVALPNNAAMMNALGSAQLAAGETVQAIATFTRLAEMAPKAPEPLVQLARAHLVAKKPDDAIKALRAALALRPDLSTIERDIAGIYVATGRHAEALAEAHRVQKEHPEQPLGYALEGEIYIAQKNLDAAERTYSMALGKFDLPVLAVRTHAVMIAAGKGAEADAMAQKWVSAHPNDTSMLMYLAQRDLVAKRYAQAEKRYQSALERQPENPLVLNNLAWVSNQLKHPNAVEYAERANELAPENPAIMDTLGLILSERGESERGLQLLGRAAELAPQAYQIRLNFAKALVKAGRKNAARKELEPLAKLDSKLPIQQEAAALLAGL